MKIEYFILPYEHNTLEPLLSEYSNILHYEGHYKMYVDKTNNILKMHNYTYQYNTIEEIIKTSYQSSQMIDLFNNASQVWNHEMWWKSISPYYNTNNTISNNLKNKIEKKYTDINKFTNQIISTGLEIFGSGWVWCVFNKEIDEIEIIKTNNAYSPITLINHYVLICLDVWEHAYYTIYNYNRKIFLEQFTKQINWTYASQQLELALMPL